MQISNETLNIIKNFTTIFPSLVIPGGNVLSTKSADQSVMAIANVAESFPVEAMIYDTSRFLAVTSLLPESNYDWQEQRVVISSPTSGQTVSWRYGDRRLLASIPPTSYQKIDSIGQFSLTKDLLNNAIRAAAVLQHDALIFSHSDAGVLITTTFTKANPSEIPVDVDNITSTSYSQIVTDQRVGADDWSFEYATDRINLIPTDYDVAISRKGGVQFSTRKESGYDVIYRISPNAKRIR